MSEFNKKNGELDFSNIKQTQLGSGNVMRASFSELQSGLRTLDTNTILKDAYTHFTQILNADDLPTRVEYWQATSPSKYEITFVRDISSNLLDTYIIFEEYISKRTILLYYDVDGNGTAPGIADEEYPVAIIENDSAFVVALSTFTVLKTLSDYFVVRSVGGSLYTKVEVQFLQFGETSPINLGTTGFSSTQTKVGTSFKVGEVFIDYNTTKDPIYNGNVLKGMVYNAYRGIFEVKPNDPKSLVFELGINYDKVEASYSGNIETYTYYLGLNVVRTTEVEYTDDCKDSLVEVRIV
jgi:hypothetical protein